MKKISKLLVVFFMLVLSMNFVMADIVGPGDNRPTRPAAPASENVISPTAIIVIGVVLAVVAAVVVVMGLNRIKNNEEKNTQMVFGSAPKVEETEQTPTVENTVEEKEDEADEEIK